MSMSKSFISGAVFRKFESEAPAGGGRRNVGLSRTQQRTVLFSDVP